jgi:hypothetical protein
MLQFKQFPLQQTYSLVRNTYHAFKGETPEVKKEAVSALGHQLLSAAVMTGVSGMPLEVLKAIGLLGNALGVSPTPSQIDDKLQQTLVGAIGQTPTNAIMGGLPAMLPWAPNMSNMAGYNADFFYGEPRDGDWKSYMWDTLAGAPGSVVSDTYNGMSDMMNGDFARGLGKITPVGAIANMAKAYTLATEGARTRKGLDITPASYSDAALKMLGFTPQRIERAYTGRTALEEEIKGQKDEKTAILEKAGQGNMAAVWKWNASNPQDRITPAQVTAARKGQGAEAVLGVKVTKANKALLQRYKDAYQ